VALLWTLCFTVCTNVQKILVVKITKIFHVIGPHSSKGKVKCTLVQALRLCTGRTAHMGSKCISLLFLDHGTRKGWGISVTPRPLFTPGKDPVPLVQEAGWDPGPVWTGVENFAPTGIRSPDRPARSQSLYRLRYPAHLFHHSLLFPPITTLLRVGIYQTEFIPALGVEISGTDGLMKRCGLLLGISFSCFCEKDISTRKHKTSGQKVMSLLWDVRFEPSDVLKLFDIHTPHAECAVCGATTHSVHIFT